MRYWPKTEKPEPETRSVTISSDEMARILGLPPGVVIRDVWTADYGAEIRFVVGDYSDSRPPGDMNVPTPMQHLLML